MSIMGKPAQPSPQTATEQPLMVDARRVRKNFGALKVLKGITLQVKAREVMCLVGPSGSGKSTFLRCINHLEQVDGGRLYVNGELIGYQERAGKLHELHPRQAAAQRREIGMVFQRFNLFAHMTALENVSQAPMLVNGVKKEPARTQARSCCAASAWPRR